MSLEQLGKIVVVLLAHRNPSDSLMDELGVDYPVLVAAQDLDHPRIDIVGPVASHKAMALCPGIYALHGIAKLISLDLVIFKVMDIHIVSLGADIDEG